LEEARKSWFEIVDFAKTDPGFTIGLPSLLITKEVYESQLLPSQSAGKLSSPLEGEKGNSNRAQKARNNV